MGESRKILVDFYTGLAGDVEFSHDGSSIQTEESIVVFFNDPLEQIQVSWLFILP